MRTHQANFHNTLDNIEQGDERSEDLLGESRKKLDEYAAFEEADHKRDDEQPYADVDSHRQIVDFRRCTELERKTSPITSAVETVLLLPFKRSH